MSEPVIEPTVLIPAGTERRAMDWSLALTSQEIEVGIERDSSSGRWMLRVPAHDEARARQTLRSFLKENRGWSLRFNSLGEEWPLQLDWAALVWVSFLVLLHGLGAAPARNTLFQPRAFHSGEWWRAFTATWLHADLGHLAMNAIFGGLLMGLAMGRYGAGIVAACTLAAGALANAIAPVFRPGDYFGLGASGVVMAALGMLTTNLAVLWKHGFRATRWIVPGLAGGTFLFFMLGLDPKADVLVHTLGFLLGLPAGFAASWIPSPHRPLASRLGWTLAAIQILLPWAWALSR